MSSILWMLNGLSLLFNFAFPHMSREILSVCGAYCPSIIFFCELSFQVIFSFLMGV